MLSKKTRIKKNELIKMIKNIKSLNPKPASIFDHQPDISVVPDIILKQNKDNFKLELNKSQMPKFADGEEYGEPKDYVYPTEKRNEHATGGVSNLFRQRQGYSSGKAVELVTKLPEFLKFVERLLIKASNEIRQGIGKWKGLTTSQKVAQHDNLTKLATEFQKTKKFDVRINEYTGIDAEKAFVEAQAEVKAK